MKTGMKGLIASVISICMMQTSMAETPAQKGLAIAQQVESHDSGWNDMKVTIKMILRNKQGDY